MSILSQEEEDVIQPPHLLLHLQETILQQCTSSVVLASITCVYFLYPNYIKSQHSESNQFSSSQRRTPLVLQHTFKLLTDNRKHLLDSIRTMSVSYLVKFLFSLVTWIIS